MTKSTRTGESERSSTEEEDLVVRSTKKVKTKEGEVDMDTVSMVIETPMETPNDGKETSMDMKKEELQAKQSYRDMLLNVHPEEEEKLILEAMKDMAGVDWINEEKEKQEGNPEENINPCPSINISVEEAEEWCRPWRQALIVRLLGKRISLKTLQTRLEKDWSRKGPIKVIDLSDEYFLVHFHQEDDYKFALFEGSCLIQDHYLILQRWRPFFKCGSDQISKVAVWVRIPNLPIEMCNAKFLWRVGSNIGTMLKVNTLTSVHFRATFARICVEIDLRKKLVPKFSVLSHEFSLEYERLHLICFHCGKYEHRAEACCEPHHPVENIPIAMVQEDKAATEAGRRLT